MMLPSSQLSVCAAGVTQHLMIRTVGLLPVIFTVAQIAHIHISIDIVRHVALSLFIADIVIDVFNLLWARVEVLFLLCLTDSPLFSFLDQPVLVVVFVGFTLIPLLGLVSAAPGQGLLCLLSPEPRPRARLSPRAGGAHRGPHHAAHLNTCQVGRH